MRPITLKIFLLFIALGLFGCRGAHHELVERKKAGTARRTQKNMPADEILAQLRAGPESGPADSSVEFWRERYRQWRSGALGDYPFSAYGAPLPKFDPTRPGKVNRRGEVVTEPPVDLPAESVHQTVPWGEPGSVWPTRDRWSMEWERRYSQWVDREVDARFLARNGIAVDCADAPYAVRWIFARMHYLPQGAHNINGAVFGNWNTRFADLPTHSDWRQDERFLAALAYVMQSYIQGRSIPYDTYPIDVGPEAGMLRPGTVVADRHHVRIVHVVDPGAIDPVRHLSSTQPRKLRVLADESLSGAIDNSGIGWGIVNWSWWDYDFARLRYLCAPDRRMPGFSLVQYDMHDMEIAGGAIQVAYRNRGGRSSGGGAAPPTADKLEARIADLAEALRVRAEAVTDGWDYYRRHPDERRYNTPAYADYSTPGRDTRLREKLRAIEREARATGMSLDWVDDRYRQVRIDVGGVDLDLNVIAWRLRHGRMSYEPWDPPWKRWGFDGPVELRPVHAEIEPRVVSKAAPTALRPEDEIRQPPAHVEQKTPSTVDRLFEVERARVEPAPDSRASDEAVRQWIDPGGYMILVPPDRE